MRWLVRIFAALAFVSLPLAAVVLSCSTGAVGVETCRAIEGARCEVAPACPGFTDSVSACKRYYRDECLVGIQNTDAGNVGPAGCVAAVRALGSCIAAEAGTCPDAPILDAPCKEAVDNVDGSFIVVDPTPCNIVLHCPEILVACNFVEAPVTDAGDAGP